MKRALLASCVMCAVVLAGCGSTDGEALSVSSAEAVQDTLPRLVEEIRLGSVDGPAHTTFGRIGAVAVTRSGDIWILDEHGPTIRVFNASGDYVRDVGGPGEGPGEYRRVLGIRAR